MTKHTQDQDRAMCVWYIVEMIYEENASPLWLLSSPKILLLFIRRGHVYIFFQHHAHAWGSITLLLFFFIIMPFPPLFFFSNGLFSLGEESTCKYGEFILVVKWEWNGILLSFQCRSLACAYMWVYDLDHIAWKVSTQVTRVWQSSME